MLDIERHYYLIRMQVKMHVLYLKLILGSYSLRMLYLLRRVQRQRQEREHLDSSNNINETHSVLKPLVETEKLMNRMVSLKVLAIVGPRDQRDSR